MFFVEPIIPLVERYAMIVYLGGKRDLAMQAFIPLVSVEFEAICSACGHLFFCSSMYLFTVSSEI